MGKYKQGNIILDSGDKIVFGDDSEQSTVPYVKSEANARYLSSFVAANDSLKVNGAYKSTDGALSSNSDALVPTQKALRTYLESLVNCLEITLSPTNYIAVDDGIQLYFGAGVGWNIYALGAARSPKGGTVKAACVTGNSWGPPSSENTDFYLGVGSNFYLIGGVDLSAGYWNTINTSLNIAITTNDNILIKLWAPTYASNPTSISANASVYIEY